MPTADVRYAGVVLLRAVDVRDADQAGGFIATPEPLPVGTSIEVVIEGAAVPANVVRVVEAATGGGMAVRFADVATTGLVGLPAARRPEVVPEASPVAPVAAAPEPVTAVPESAAEPTAAAATPAQQESGGKGRRGRRKRH